MRNRPLFRVCLLAACALAAALLLTTGGAPLFAAAAPQGSALQAAISKARPALIRIQVVEAGYGEGRETKSESSGSGIIISPEGHAVTNHHVAGDAKSLIVTLSDRSEVKASVVGTDPLSDIAVIKLLGAQGRKFPSASFGDSSAVRVGDTVLAMGSPVALSQSVTMGIVSNTEMIMPAFWWPFNRLELQGEDVGSMVRWIGHDALILGGNSGGPLVNLKGEIIGINEIAFGLSGAIPGNLVKDVAGQLITKGRVSRSWLGIDIQPLLKSSSVRTGALVSGVFDGSPADKAGIRSGDVIVKLSGKDVSVLFGEQVPLFNQMAAALPVGKPAELVTLRDGKRSTVTLVPVEREEALPRERELREWGITARNISFLMATEMDRDSREGALITSTASGGPADDARPPLRARDIIVAVGGDTVKSVSDLQAATARVLKGKKDRQPVLVEFDRGTERYVTVVRVGQDPLRDPGLEASKAWLPIGLQVLTKEVAETLGVPGQMGVRVTEVYAGKSAAKAGLKVGDIITALDGEPIEASQPQDLEVLPAMVRQKTIGDMAELTVLRAGKPVTVKLELEPSPKLPREMKRYKSEDFEFTARNITFADKSRTPSAQRKSVSGVVVESVEEGGWAAVGRLAVGDIIIEVDGSAVGDVAALQSRMEAIRSAKAERVVFHVRRGIREMFVEVQPAWTAGE